MSDATQSTPFPADPPPPAGPADPLAGDWSEGLRTAVRALGIPDPVLLKVESIVPAAEPRPAMMAPTAPAPVEVAETPDGWGAAAEDPLESQPPPSVVVMAQVPAGIRPPEITPPSPAPAFEAGKTPT